VATRVLNIEPEPQRRQLAEDAERHRLQPEAGHPLAMGLRGLRQRFPRGLGVPEWVGELAQGPQPHRCQRMA
jgi:hypothetical protein